MAAPRSAGRRSAPGPCRRRAPRPRRTRSLGRTIRQLRPSLRTRSRTCRIRGRCFRKPTAAVARQRSARYPKSAKAEAPPGGFVLGRQGPRGEVGVGILSPGADAAAAVRTRRRSTRGIIRHSLEAQCPGRARGGPRTRATEHCSVSRSCRRFRRHGPGAVPVVAPSGPNLPPREAARLEETTLRHSLRERNRPKPTLASVTDSGAVS